MTQHDQKTLASAKEGAECRLEYCLRGSGLIHPILTDFDTEILTLLAGEPQYWCGVDGVL